MAGRAPTRLRHRLFLTYLAFAALPSLVLAAVAYHSLGASLDLWRTPAVSRALEGSLGVARQLLSERRPALEARLDSLLAAARVRTPGPALTAPQVTAGTLLSGPFDAVGLSPANHPEKIRWTLRPGRRAPRALLERRLAVMPHDTLVVAGSGHLALVHIDGAHRWTVLTPLPPGIRTPLQSILEAQAFYDELDDYRRVARRGLLLGTLAILALVIVLSWIGASAVAHGVTRPLETLALAMGALSRGGPAPPVGPAGDAELRELAAAFESMRADLEASRRDLARAERAAAWREVARRIAHEIKNPLTPVKLAVHRLRSLEASLGPAERERLTESLDAVDHEVETLRRMADAFSRFSRLPEPERRPCEVAPMLRSVAEMYEGSPLRLEWEAPGAPSASLDEGQLRQALHNLIQNAADATNGHGPVRIMARADSRDGRAGLMLEVRDGGPGFGPEALVHAGEPYFTEKTHGTGLGLAMVRRIVEGHGGGMQLGNAEGGGARVELWLPGEEEA